MLICLQQISSREMDGIESSQTISDQNRSYLNHISKTREDCQVKQAEAALRLYGYYLSSEPKTLEDSVETGPEEVCAKGRSDKGGGPSGSATERFPSFLPAGQAGGNDKLGLTLTLP